MLALHSRMLIKIKGNIKPLKSLRSYGLYSNFVLQMGKQEGGIADGFKNL
jgi:hypothetical protein